MMRALGFALLTAGFLGASLVAVQTEANQVNWTYFVPALAAAVVGVVLARVGERQHAAETAAEGTGIRDLRAALDRVVDNVRALHGEGNQVDPYALHGRIDELFVADLNLFADNRKQIGELFGLQAYAEIMNEFAAGERYLNRVWSASVDGYIDECVTYIGKAREQFELAQAALKRFETA